MGTAQGAGIVEATKRVSHTSLRHAHLRSGGADERELEATRVATTVMQWHLERFPAEEDAARKFVAR